MLGFVARLCVPLTVFRGVMTFPRVTWNSWRSRVIRNKWIKIVEVLVITSIMVIGSFVIPIALGVCTPLPEDATTNGNSEDYFVPFYCPHGEYSLLASLFLAPADVSAAFIALFLHDHDCPRLR